MLVTLKIQCYVVRFLGDLNFTVSEAHSNSEFSLLAMKISLLAENFPVAMLQGCCEGITETTVAFRWVFD